MSACAVNSASMFIVMYGSIWPWVKHILFMTEHDKGLGRAKKLCLALSKTHTHAHIICYIDEVSTIANAFTHHQYRDIPRIL